MKRIISLIIFFMVSLAVLIMFPVVALSEPIGTFTYIKGRVDITAPGMKAVPAHKGDDVNVGDIIRTKSNSKAEILLIDGSTLRFAQKSRVKINEYMVEKKQARGVLKLFRGKIQNIVKTAGKTFGRKRINSYEVHTPTAVCGVRGTNFFVFHKANISGAIFKKGSGYGYSVNRPDVVKTIKAGQAMIVISPDQPPVIKPATDLEIEQHMEDTAPSEEEEEAEEEEEEKVEAVEEEAEAEKETAEEAPAEEEEVAEEEAPVEEGEVAEEAPAEEAAHGQEEAGEAPLPAAEEEQVVSSEPTPEPTPAAPEPSVETDAEFISESFVDVDLGLPDGDIADTLAVEIDTVDTTLETLEPYIPPTEVKDTTPPVITIASAASPEPGNLTTVNLDLSSNETVTYSYTLDGAIVTTTNFSELIEGEHIFGYTATDEAGNTSSDTLSFDLHRYTLTGSVSGTGSVITGSVTAGAVSAVAKQDWGGWILELEGTYTGTHSPSWEMTAGGQTSDSSGCPNGYWIETIDGTPGTSNLTFLTYMTLGTGTGAVTANFYDNQTWDATDSGIGTLTETPLAFIGYWEGGSLYYNNNGNMDYAGEEYGLIGGLSSPWDGPAEFLAMGEYSYEGGLEGKDHYLWNTEIYAFDTLTEGGTGESLGLTGGIWKNGAMEGTAVALCLKMDSESESVLAGYATGGVSGAYYPDLGMWKVEGTLAPSDKQIEFDYDSIYGGYGYISSRLSGNFYEGAGSILGNGEWGEIFYIADYGTETTGIGPLRGIYDLMLGCNNTYNDKPSGNTTWSARVGGNVEFYDSSVIDGVGYWLADVGGDWTGEGEITGSLDGTFLTSTHTGPIKGSFYGINAMEEGESGTWIGESLGTFTGDPLAFSSSFSGDTYRNIGGTFYKGDFGRWNGSYYDEHYEYEYFVSNVSEGSVLQYGEKWHDYHDYYESDSEYGDIYLPDGTHVSITEDDFLTFTRGSWTVGAYDSNFAYFSDPPDDGGTWERHWYEEWPSFCLAKSGTFSGIMGGTGDLWSATDSNPAGITLMGMYTPTDGDYTKPSIFGFGIQNSDITTGAYAGYLSGITDGMKGNIYAVYIDPSQNAGILKGGFSGNVYPDIEMWEASGSIYPVEMTTSIGVLPDALSENMDNRIMVGWVSRGFGATGSELSSELGWGETLSIKGEDWGVYRLSFGYDNYAYNPGSLLAWSARAGGYGEFGTYESNDTTNPWKPDMGIWMTDQVSGNLADGIVAGLSGEFLTLTKYGRLAGDVTGTYDNSGDWQAVSSGYWESSQALKFNGVIRGRDLRIMVEEYHGHWDDETSGGSYYNYSYETGVNAGWSYEYNASTNTETHINYQPDGTTEIWVDADGALSYDEGTWSDDLYENNLKIGSTLTGDVLRNPDPSYYLGYNGWLDGSMGGLDDLWTASASVGADVRFIGEYDEWYDEVLPSVFSMGIKSYNPYDGSCTIWNQVDNSQNGAYYGYMDGRTLGDNTLEGGILALYLDQSGNMGILKGDFDGNLYPDAAMWDGAGGIYPIELVQSTDLNAFDLHPDDGGLIRINEFDSGSGEFNGLFFDVSNDMFGGSIDCMDWDSKNAGIKTTGTLNIGSQLYDQYLSVTSTIHGGTYTEFNENTFDHWDLPFSFGDGTIEGQGYLLSFSDAPGSWSDNMISGKGVGSWVNLDEVVTGVSGADLKGTFNPVNATWQTAASWAGMDTRTFLTMAATTAGQDKLAQLNIPCIEVGRTDLAGNDGNLYVNMNDTTFFAYSNGAPPRIWATGDVSGTYTADPSVGTNVSLTGTDISANFGVQKWDTNQWAADVNGSGMVADHDIYITGSAAGQYTGGAFSGTGSGVAHETTGGLD